jgi:uncharacterized protein (TIGR00266 family)
MNHKISGGNLQIVTLEINPNELVFAEAGAMVYMSGNMSMEAKARGGFFKGLKRKFMGESFFLTEFRAQGGPGIVSFAGNAPGTIKAIQVAPGREFMCQKDAFLCAEHSVDMDIAFQKKLGSAFFGGEGFIIQRLFGQGTVFIHGCGDFIEMDLKPGQVMKVDTGSVVGWEPTVQYDIQRAGGVKTSLFGGEGIFLTTLTGPGHIILQSMTLANLAFALSPFMAARGGGSSGSVGLNLLGS